MGFEFQHRLDFTPAEAEAVLRQIPAAPGVFALYGPEAAEPYLTRAADLRRRVRRILAPPEVLDADGAPVLSKRLNLRDRVRGIAYTRTGSEFESLVTLYAALRGAFGDEQARKRMRLYPPYFLRLTMTHAHPRLYVTNRLSPRSLAECFGPFPSRAAAERYCDAVLDLFQLRRCYEDLVVHPDHPGCAYGEMKKCAAPCKAACTPEAYAGEAEAVRDFLASRGESLLGAIARERDGASEAMDFELAATLHKRYEHVKAAAALADEVVRPAAAVRALVLQEAAPVERDGGASAADEAAVFLLAHGQLCGPARLSTLGVRAVREQTAVGSSLFAQPLMLAAIPLEGPVEDATETSGMDAVVEALGPEDRARALLAKLEEETGAAEATTAGLCDTLALFRRWYYRPEKQRAGEVFLPNADGSWPVRRVLNGAARIALGPPAKVDAVNREAAREALKALKTKTIHEGREGVEREVPVLPKRLRPGKAVISVDDK